MTNFELILVAVVQPIGISSTMAIFPYAAIPRVLGKWRIYWSVLVPFDNNACMCLWVCVYVFMCVRSDRARTTTRACKVTATTQTTVTPVSTASAGRCSRRSG